MQNVVLTGRRIRLREVQGGDLGDVYRMLEEPRQVRYVEWEATEESATALLSWSLSSAKQEPRMGYSLAMTLPTDDKLIGVFSLLIRDAAQREGHLGIILNRRYQGKGLPIEAGRLIIQFAFEPLKLHRLCAGCNAANKASRRMIEKAGFRREGYLKESRWEKGRWNDWISYAMLDHEWTTTSDQKTNYDKLSDAGTQRSL